MVGTILTSIVIYTGIILTMDTDIILTGEQAGTILGLDGVGLATMAGMIHGSMVDTGAIVQDMLTGAGIQDMAGEVEEPALTVIRSVADVLQETTTDLVIMLATVRSDISAMEAVVGVIPQHQEVHGATLQPAQYSVQADGVVHSLTIQATIHLTTLVHTLHPTQEVAALATAQALEAEAVASVVEDTASEAAVAVASEEVVEVTSVADAVKPHPFSI